jgi:hypothetical protein
LTTLLQNISRTQAGSLDNNVYSSDDDFWQADVCNISKALLANSTAGTLSCLSNEDCILAYGSGNGNMKGWANLLVVAKDTVTLPYPNTTILLQFRYQEYVFNYTGNDWVCDPDYLIDNNYKCNYKHFAANASSLQHRFRGLQFSRHNQHFQDIDHFTNGRRICFKQSPALYGGRRQLAASDRLVFILRAQYRGHIHGVG